MVSNLRAKLVPFAAGVAGGALGMYMYQTMAISLPSHHHPAIRFGLPQTSSTRFFTNFVSEVDFGTRNPKWVLEHLDEAQTSSRVASRKSARYHEDEEIDPRFRSRLSQYVPRTFLSRSRWPVSPSLSSALGVCRLAGTDSRGSTGGT